MMLRCKVLIVIFLNVFFLPIVTWACSWNTWGSWNTCPVTCGGGTHSRTRTGSSCSPNTDTETQTCNTYCCPVNGGWGTWEEWYACSSTCGTGSQYRFRYCNSPAVKCSGSNCPGCTGSYCGNTLQKSTETRSCNIQNCIVCENREIGYGTPSSFISTIGSNTGYGVLAESGFYEATCCGVISSWEFYASRVGQLHLMVWRKTGTTYTLVGKNVYTVTSGMEGQTISFTVAELDRLTIMDNDMLGWYTPASEIIPYSTSVPDNFRRIAMSETEEGNTFDWSTVPKAHDIAYAIKAITANNETPFFTNLNRQVVIFDDQPSGSNIYRVEYYTSDTRDTITLTYTSTSTSLSFNTLTKQVYLSDSLAVGAYNMVFQMEDSCGNVAISAYLAVTVMNTPPRITNLPSSITLHEDVVEGRILYTVDVIDRQSTDTITCSLSAETPSSGNFKVERVDGTTDYGIYLISSPSFDFESVKKYTITIACEDGKNTAVTGMYFVNIQKNHPPRFLNLQASIDLNATSTLIGDIVYSVTMTDDESDTLTFTMTTDPSNAPFQLLDYGDIVTTADLSTIFTPAYNLEISLNDGRTTVGPRTLSVHIINMNDKPVFANLALTEPFRIEENDEVGMTLYHILVRDLDPTDTHLIQGIFTPTTGSTYFSLSSDGYLKIASSLDYESMPATSFTVVIKATDGKDTATATITIIVTDENEPPVFHQAGYSVEAFEGSQNDPFPPADLQIDDPDTGEVFTYWLDCGNDTWRFTMEQNTGAITYAYDYDVDKLLTTRYDCKVRAKDTGFNTCTASLIINIKDANDNHPYFNQTQYAFYVSPYESVGTEIGNVTAYDVDISAFGTMTYNLDMSAYTELYIQINDNGTLYVNKHLSSRFQSGDVMDLTLTAVDYGGLTTTVQVLIIFPEENTTTSSTTPALMTITSSPNNTLWFTAVAMLAAMTAIGILYYCAKNCMNITFFQTTSAKEKIDITTKNTDEKANSESKKLKSIDLNKPSNYHNPKSFQPYSKIINVRKPVQAPAPDGVSNVTASSVVSSNSKHLYRDKEESLGDQNPLMDSMEF